MNLTIYTNEAKAGDAAVPVPGSKVYVGDTELQHVAGVTLEAMAGGVWQAHISVFIDPVQVIKPLPAP